MHAHRHTERTGNVGPVRCVLEDPTESAYKEEDFIAEDNDQLDTVRYPKSITSALFIRSSSASSRSKASRGKRASCLACFDVSRAVVAHRHSGGRCATAATLHRRQSAPSEEFNSLHIRLEIRLMPHHKWVQEPTRINDLPETKPQMGATQEALVISVGTVTARQTTLQRGLRARLC